MRENGVDRIIEEHGPADRRLIRMVVRFARPHWRPMLGAVLLLPLITAAQQVQPYLFKVAIDGPIHSQAASGPPPGAITPEEYRRRLRGRPPARRSTPQHRPPKASSSNRKTGGCSCCSRFSIRYSAPRPIGPAQKATSAPISSQICRQAAASMDTPSVPPTR